MNEFNELVKAYLLGNNVIFEESEKENNTLILSDINKKRSFTAKLFGHLKVQKESLKIFMLDNTGDNIELNDTADIIIWNDSFSGKNLASKIKAELGRRTKQTVEVAIGDFDSRFLGMGKDILFAKFYGPNRTKEILEVARLPLAPGFEEKSFFTNETLGKKRFNFILEETAQEQYLKQEYNRFMEFFCRSDGLLSHSLPLFFNSIDFWFGGMLHALVTNRLNQDLGLFVTEDTVFYMIRLGYLIPFIAEMDLFCKETYLNPQAPQIAHLFYLCGERGMFVSSCTWDSVLFENVKGVITNNTIAVLSDDDWLLTIAKPMGSRILDDKDNAQLFNTETGLQKQLVADDIIKKNEQIVNEWLDNPDFPILKPTDRRILLKQVAAKWLERDGFYLDLEDFYSILFTSDILREGKRTLSHVHEIVRAIMSSGVMVKSDYNHIIPVSNLMGEAVIRWMLTEEYNDTEITLEKWLDRRGLNQRVIRNLLKRFAEQTEKNIFTPLSHMILNLLNDDRIHEAQPINPEIIKNAFEMHIAITNGNYVQGARPVTSSRLYDLNMSHKIIINLELERADMHNILLQQSVFIGCRFVECNLTSSYNAGSTFLHCLFEKTSLKNADFSGSYFRGCTFIDNGYENAILFGCSFSDCQMELDLSPGGKHRDIKLWTDGSSGVLGKEQGKEYDLPILIYLLQRQYLFFSRYGFKINPDVGFHYSDKPWGMVKDEGFLEKYNYFDLYDQGLKKPELFFAKPGSIHHIHNGEKTDYPNIIAPKITIDHVIKYRKTDDKGTETWHTKILYHTPTETLVEENPNHEHWFQTPRIISKKFVGRGVSGIFVNPVTILMSTDLGGLFLFQWREGNWTVIDSKFQSEPATQVFPDCFESMVFVKRGATVIEIWDTLNDLSLFGKVVTSFGKIIGIRLIENLNHVIIYGEWGDGSIGALVYNIINKHLVTYWPILSQAEAGARSEEHTQMLEGSYKSKVAEILAVLKEKSSREVSLETGYIKEGRRELQQILDSLAIIHPEMLIYMEGEPVEFQWVIKNNSPSENIGLKTYIDIESGEVADFEFEIKIGDIISVLSGKMNMERSPNQISVLWKEDPLKKSKGDIWGDHKLIFSISLLGETRQEVRTFKIRPANPFKGGVSLSKEMGSDYLFVGRDNELKKALELIDRGNSFTIKGARRIGKTSFINRLRENLPGKILTAYISLDEFEKNKTRDDAASKISTGTTQFSQKYPAIYNEYAEMFTSLQNALYKVQTGTAALYNKHPDVYREFKDLFSSLKSALFALDFEWLMARGLEKLKERYPEIVEPIWPKLEEYIKAGKDGGAVFSRFAKYLDTFNNPPKIVLLIDEIGIANTKGVALNNLFNPFRPLIDSYGIIVILTGIPYNFHELTSALDVQTDSGFMSYVGDHIVLGPLTDLECKQLIRNNLSKRINVSETVLDHALNMSTRRPEDLQLIMHHAMENLGKKAADLKVNNIKLKRSHIECGFDQLLEIRGYTCSKIWEKISGKGKRFLKTQLKTVAANPEKSLNIPFKQMDEKNILKEDIEIFKGYGFSTPDETELVLPMYFQEWVRREFYKREFKKEDNKYED